MFWTALIAGALCLASWIYLLLAHGGFWKVKTLLASTGSPAELDRPVAVIIPARNEAEHIGDAVRSLLRQTTAHALHIFVVDDASTDDTAQIARDAACNSGPSDVVTVISGSPLPAGWTGKLWALEQGIRQAILLRPKFLLFTDADILHSPGNIASLVSIAENGGYDLASFMVKLHCGTLPERLLVPPFVFFFFLLYPPAWIRDPRRKTAGAAGGCVLIRPEALQKADGIAAIQNQIIDDCALARAVKCTGGRVWLGMTADTHSARVYGTFAEIERMIARTAFNQLHHSLWLLLGSILGLTLAYLVPLMLLVTGDWRLAILGALSWALMALIYLPMVRFYGLSVLWALTLPFAACFYMAATLHSAFKFLLGRGGEWKGRSQDQSPVANLEADR